jgi:hypothetical protein
MPSSRCARSWIPTAADASSTVTSNSARLWLPPGNGWPPSTIQRRCGVDHRRQGRSHHRQRRCRSIRQRVKRGAYRMLQPVSPLWQCSPPPQGLQRQPQLTTAWGCSTCTGAGCSQSGLSTWSGRRCRPPMVCLLWLWSPRAKVWSSIAAKFKTIAQFID